MVSPPVIHMECSPGCTGRQLHHPHAASGRPPSKSPLGLEGGGGRGCGDGERARPREVLALEKEGGRRAQRNGRTGRPDRESTAAGRRRLGEDTAMAGAEYRTFRDFYPF